MRYFQSYDLETLQIFQKTACVTLVVTRLDTLYKDDAGIAEVRCHGRPVGL